MSLLDRFYEFNGDRDHISTKGHVVIVIGFIVSVLVIAGIINLLGLIF